MHEEVLSIAFGVTFTYKQWNALQEQFLLASAEREAHLKSLLMITSKGSLTIDEYHCRFKHVCDNLAAINKPLFDLDMVSQFSRGLEAKYKIFHTSKLTKPPYPTLQELLLALQSYE
uniref:Retrotransposon gag domain-containing protein n=1 Tax=Manihot esculenta TaxID=3983 RepID=A0A2C9UZM1_MANES